MADPPTTNVVAARSGRGGRLRALALVGLGVALVVAAIAGALREPTALDPTGPEAAVQRYLQAVLDGDFHQAASVLAPGSRCQASDVRQAWIPESLTVSLDHVRAAGDQADVRVRLRSAAGPPPFGEDVSFMETFSLARTGDTWRLTGEPWPLVDCG